MCWILKKIQLLGLLQVQLLCGGFCYGQCAQNFPTFERPSPLKLPRGVQILVPAYHFNCSGTIVEWGARLHKRMPSRIDFQVWRVFNEKRGGYQLIGTNTVVNPMVGRDRRLIVPVPDRLRIQVERGDVVGVYIGREGDIQIEYTPSRSIVTYITNTNGPLDEFFTRDPVDVDVPLSRPLDGSPQIYVAVESVPVAVSPSPTSNAQTTSGLTESSRITGGQTVGLTSSLPTSTFPPTLPSLSTAQLNDIIVGAVVAALALVVLGMFLITVIVCVKIKRLPKSDKSSRGVNPESRSESPLIPLDLRTISTHNSSAGATPDHQGVILVEAETHFGATMDKNSNHARRASLINMHENPSYTTLPSMQPEYEIIPDHTPRGYEIPVSGSEDVATATGAIHYSDVIYEEVQ